jgi:hypothetical protein
MKTFAVPIVTAITPDASTVGCRIKVTGSNLDFVDGATVGGAKCAVEDVTPTTLTVIVAKDAVSGPVVVSNDTGAALHTPKFTVTVEAQETTQDKTAREQAAKDQQASDKAAIDQITKDQAARVQATKDQPATDKAAREQAALDKAAGEKAVKEQAARDQKSEK